MLGAMLSEPVAAGDWLVIAPVVIPITLGALLLMLRHHLRWQAALASGGLLLMLVADCGASRPRALATGRW